MKVFKNSFFLFFIILYNKKDKMTVTSEHVMIKTQTPYENETDHLVSVTTADREVCFF